MNLYYNSFQIWHNSCHCNVSNSKKILHSSGIKNQSPRSEQLKLALLLFIFFYSLSSYSLSSRDKWKLLRSYGNISIYTSTNNTRLTVNSKEYLSKSFKIKKNMIEKTANKKSQMLSMMGMKNWKISSSRITREKNSSKFYIQGSYTDSKDRKVHFIELHYYKSRGALQMLLTHSNPVSLQQDSQETTLNPIRKKYGF